MLAFRLNILRHAVCAACGADPDTRFLHLCRARARHLRRAVVPVMEDLPDPARAAGWSTARLRRLGRIPHPLLRRGDDPFVPLDWNDAVKLAAARLGPGGRVIVGDRSLSCEARWVRDRLAAALLGGPAILTLGPAEVAASFRAHVVEFLEPRLLVPAEEALFLPASSRWSQAGGATWSTPTGPVYSPEIRGNPVPEARPDWWILSAIGRRLDPEGPFGADDADALRDQAGEGLHPESLAGPR